MDLFDTPDKEEILKQIIDCGYSRIPVFKNSIDNIIGLFYTKEIMREYIKNKDLDLKEFLREAFFVVGSKKISDLLNVFQQKKQHLAIVIDEFGGTEGILTLEDILEELVGEIQDEEDDEDYKDDDSDPSNIESLLELMDSKDDDVYEEEDEDPADGGDR